MTSPRWTDQVDWKSETEFSVNGFNFAGTGDYTLKSAPDRFIVLKGRHFLETELALVDNRPVRDILEFGIWQGGSVVLMDQLFKPDTLVSVDFSPTRVEALDDYIANHARAPHIHAYNQFNQADAGRVDQLLRTHFPDGVDLIIDDASHFYDESRTSFCTAFPWLRPGGVYIVEDWAWAHWPAPKLWENDYFRGRKALTNLLTELSIACAFDASIIAEVRVYSSLFAVIRGPAVLPRTPGGLDLSSMTASQGRPFEPVL